jgi:hypothetical protein
MQYDIPLSQGRELPIFSLRELDMPEVRQMEVGDKRYVVLKVEMIAKNSGRSLGYVEGNDSSKVEGEYRVLSIRALGHDPVDARTLESEEFNNVIAKVKSGEM